jgi:hypothetical protein
MPGFIAFDGHIKRSELTAQLNRKGNRTQHPESQKRFGPSVPYKRCKSPIQMRRMQAATW